MNKVKIILIVIFLLFIKTGCVSHPNVYLIEKSYHPNGVLQAEFNVVNGKEEGIAKTYYESGALEGEYNFVNGKLEGIEFR